MKETPMITIETLSQNIRNARAQEEQYRANMNAAAGAAQAFELLLTELLQAQRKAKAEADAKSLGSLQEALAPAKGPFEACGDERITEEPKAA